jgi:hypothetical protein
VCTIHGLLRMGARRELVSRMRQPYLTIPCIHARGNHVPKAFRSAIDILRDDLVTVSCLIPVSKLSFRRISQAVSNSRRSAPLAAGICEALKPLDSGD